MSKFIKSKKVLVLVLALVLMLGTLLLSSCGGANVDGKYYIYENGKTNTSKYIDLKGKEWSDYSGASGTFNLDGEEIVFYSEVFGKNEEMFSGTLKDGVLKISVFGATKTYYLSGKAPADSTPGGNPGTNSGSDGGEDIEQVTVTYNANGGKFSDSSEQKSSTVDKGSTLTAPETPVRSSYTFAGWSATKNAQDLWKFASDKADKNVTLYAVWVEPSASIISAEGASIDEKTMKVLMLVSPEVDSVSLSSKIVCSGDSTWKLYYDKLGQTEIPTKIAASSMGELKNGDNVFYVVVTSRDGVQVNVYELVVHRSYMVNISYLSNKGTLLHQSQVYTGNEFTASYKPTISGYTFNHWKDSDGSKVTSFTPYGAKTLYADCTANKYDITLNVNGGEELSNNEKTVTFDKGYTLPVPKRVGHSFLGWSYSGDILTSSGGSSLAEWTMASDRTLKAEWKANTYALNLSVNNTSAGTVNGKGDYTYGTRVTMTASTNSGYTFLGWYCGSELVSSNLSYTITKGLDETYTAKWILRPITAEKNISAAGRISGIPSTSKLGDSVTLTASTNSGYTWLGWYNGDTLLTTDLSYSFTMPTENVTYTAKWTYYTITTNTNLSGSGTYTIKNETKTTVGDSVTLTASTNSGYTWLGWYNGDTLLTTDLSYSFTMPAENVTYTAKRQMKAEMSAFTFTSTPITCTITGVNDKTVTSLTIPTYVTDIAADAFSECTALESVNFTGTKEQWDGIASAVCYKELGSGEYKVFSEHNYSGSTCENCGKLYKRVDDNTILFGSYPQSVVTDSSAVDALIAAAGALPTSTDIGNWTGYGFYGSSTDYMWYIDIKHSDGEKYRGVYFVSYRNSYQDYNGYYTGEVYWFKYEPISWRILEEENGVAFLLCDMIIDSQDYYHSTSNRTESGTTIYPNNYAYSNIREWLNDNFYNTAFSALEKEIILLTTVDNSAASTRDEDGNLNAASQYACADTNDYVFLLSKKEVTSDKYGFASYSTYDTARWMKSTDYAKAQGTYVSTSSDYAGNGWWWLRSPSSDFSFHARYVFIYGYANYSDVVYYRGGGVVPALRITL